MKCPYCGELDKDHVLDSRPVRDGAAIKRRRECEACRGRFTTFEEIEELRLLVIKSGERGSQPFDRSKLRRAVETACKKRPVSDEQITALVEDIERILYSRQEKEVSSAEIGEMMMERLLPLDPVAYVRFASVYRQFEDAQQFKLIVGPFDAPARARCQVNFVEPERTTPWQTNFLTKNRPLPPPKMETAARTAAKRKPCPIP